LSHLTQESLRGRKTSGQKKLIPPTTIFLGKKEKEKAPSLKKRYGTYPTPIPLKEMDLQLSSIHIN
ncbi:hypothetical protein C9439_01565, partial [archaeon SCG-AAA382B04]